MELIQDTETQPKGYFVISDNAPTGAAYAVFLLVAGWASWGAGMDAGDKVIFGIR